MATESHSTETADALEVLAFVPFLWALKDFNVIHKLCGL